MICTRTGDIPAVNSTGVPPVNPGRTERLMHNNATPTNDPPLRIRMQFGFSVDGDVRFISHHDTVRMFERAFARANLPISFTQGFNPHPRMSLPLPRPVGIASDDETLVVDFDKEFDPSEATQNLDRQMPTGVRIKACRCIARSARFIDALVTYQLETPLEATSPVPDDLSARIRHLLASPSMITERTHHKTGVRRSIDLRPFIESISAGESGVEFILRVTQQGSARPAEIAGLLGFPNEFINHCIRRLEVRWQQNEQAKEDAN